MARLQAGSRPRRAFGRNRDGAQHLASIVQPSDVRCSTSASAVWAFIGRPHSSPVRNRLMAAARGATVDEGASSMATRSLTHRKAQELAILTDLYGVSATWLLKSQQPSSGDRAELAAEILAHLSDEAIGRLEQAIRIIKERPSPGVNWSSYHPRQLGVEKARLAQLIGSVLDVTRRSGAWPQAIRSSGRGRPPCLDSTLRSQLSYRRGNSGGGKEWRSIAGTSC